VPVVALFIDTGCGLCADEIFSAIHHPAAAAEEQLVHAEDVVRVGFSGPFRLDKLTRPARDQREDLRRDISIERDIVRLELCS
jgi:hypothetical protein